MNLSINPKLFLQLNSNSRNDLINSRHLAFKNTTLKVLQNLKIKRFFPLHLSLSYDCNLSLNSSFRWIFVKITTVYAGENDDERHLENEKYTFLLPADLRFVNDYKKN